MPVESLTIRTGRRGSNHWRQHGDISQVLFEDTVEGGGNIAQVDADFVADMHCHDPGCHQEGDQVSVIMFFPERPLVITRCINLFSEWYQYVG